MAERSAGRPAGSPPSVRPRPAVGQVLLQKTPPKLQREERMVAAAGVEVGRQPIARCGRAPG